MALYSIIYNSQEVGPMTLNQLAHYNITPETFVKIDDGPFVKAYKIPEVMAIIPPQYTSNPGNAYTSNTSSAFVNTYDKSQVVAGLLAILLGYLGLQYFYIGKTAAGIFTILLTIFTCGLWEIISLVQGIIMLTMTPEQFQAKYVNNPATFPIF